MSASYYDVDAKVLVQAYGVIVSEFFGSLDNFHLLHRELTPLSTVRVWAPAVLLALAATVALYWNASDFSRIRAFFYFLVSALIPVACAFYVKPSLDAEGMRDFTSATVAYPYSFAPFSVYPIGGLVLVAVALLRFTGLSSRVRYIASVLGLIAGIVVFCSVQSVAKKEVKRNFFSDNLEVSVTAVFLDAFFMAMMNGLFFFISPCIFKDVEERLRLPQGGIMVYDLYKLFCINSPMVNKSLVYPHIFATPLLIAFNVASHFRNRKAAAAQAKTAEYAVQQNAQPAFRYELQPAVPV